jgi:hypothetical protein
VTPPTPPARTVDEVVGPYSNFLVPVPARGASDTCPTCHSVVYDDWTRCFACFQAIQTLGTGVADVTAFVSLAPADEQLARELYTYKRLTVPAHLRHQRMVGLAAVLWKWLSLHEVCVAAALGIRSFDIVTSVPSASGRPGEHSPPPARVWCRYRNRRPVRRPPQPGPRRPRSASSSGGSLQGNPKRAGSKRSVEGPVKGERASGP